MPQDLIFKQASSIINELNSQATGTTTIAPVDLTQFMSMADTLLKTGYDPVIQSISQVLGKTIFSIRPYKSKFDIIRKSSTQYGNHVRKLQVCDKPFEDDARVPLEDGSSVDMFKVNKPDVLQTNFYGADVYEKSLTYFKDQLDNAFMSPEDLVSFTQMYTQNANDLIAQADENTQRAVVANMIMATVKSWGSSTHKNKRVIRLITEYNEETGEQLTPETVKAPENYPNFIKWAYAKIRSIASLMTERNNQFIAHPAGKNLNRHTPYENMKMLISAPELYSIESRVLTDLFNDRYMKLVDYEVVNFWQSIDSPTDISLLSSYYDEASGTIKQMTSEEGIGDVFAVIFDEEALGVTRVNEWNSATPLNAKGGYTNFFWHFTNRYWNDFSENCCVFILA